MHRAKNHISPEEPYYAMFNYNCFQRYEANFGPFFETLRENLLELIGIREKKMFL